MRAIPLAKLLKPRPEANPVANRGRWPCGQVAGQVSGQVAGTLPRRAFLRTRSARILRVCGCGRGAKSWPRLGTFGMPSTAPDQITAPRLAATSKPRATVVAGSAFIPAPSSPPARHTRLGPSPVTQPSHPTKSPNPNRPTTIGQSKRQKSTCPAPTSSPQEQESSRNWSILRVPIAWWPNCGSRSAPRVHGSAQLCGYHATPAACQFTSAQ